MKVFSENIISLVVVVVIDVAVDGVLTRQVVVDRVMQ